MNLSLSAILTLLSKLYDFLKKNVLIITIKLFSPESFHIFLTLKHKNKSS